MSYKNVRRFSGGGDVGALLSEEPAPNYAHTSELFSRDDWRADLSANYLARDHYFHSSILLPALSSVIGGHWLSFSEALRSDRTRRHSLLCQIVAHRLAALFGKALIVGITADAVRVTFDVQP